MSRRNRVPSYRLHKQSGQAVVTLSDGLGRRRDVLLGAYDSSASRKEYARVIAEWEVANRQLPPERTGAPSVNEVLLRYHEFAEGYYQKNGQPTSQLDRVRRSLTFVKDLYGLSPATEFGALALKAVRARMVEGGWARRHINQCIGCVKRCFKWAASEELIPASIPQALWAVEGLKRGRTTAKESQPILSVEDALVETTLPYMNPPVRCMVQLQRLTGMRPGEVILMRSCDIDRTGRTWFYTPESHKTEHHGMERVIYLGPQAQVVLQPFLFRDPDAYLFSPREAIAALRARQRAARKTKVQPSQVCRKKPKPKKPPRDRYTRDSYGRAITYAVARANRERLKVGPIPPSEYVPHWHANQLRHSAATEVRQRFGLEAAQILLGHAKADVTQVYAERDRSLGERVASAIG
jgi:integrase